MKIEYVKFWTRKDVETDVNSLYLFGDNVKDGLRSNEIFENNARFNFFKNSMNKQLTETETQTLQNMNRKVFNTIFVPKSTQAVIRGLSNAYGIYTKSNRLTLKESYFTDKEIEEFVNLVNEQFSFLIEILKNNKDVFSKVVIPLDGLGTGKAKLSEQPKCWKMFCREYEKFKQEVEKI